MKWFLAALGLIAIGAFVYIQRNATKTSYVNGLAAYNQLPGKEYLFQQDCYIFKLTDRDTSWPLVGTHDVVPELPAEVDRKLIGAALPGVRILDVARVGDRFKIVSVRREESRRGTVITFEILFTNEAERAYPRLDAFWILDHTPESRGEAPVLIERFAVPRIKG